MSASARARQRWSEQKRGDDEQLIGTVLGDRYRIDELIGAGGMGLVYKATHLLIGRKLAIKVLRRRHALDDDVAKRFAQEAQVASRVKHANVVDIIDYGTTSEGSPYCVMEFLGGRSLAQELAEGPLEPARALAIARDVARGLAAAHRAGVIHRDLKPDNVFLVAADADAPELVKILDFGIARVVDREIRLTAIGSVVGTPEYMSPEQARGEVIDARSDLYALGVLLFEALTGQVPLRGESAVATLTKQVFDVVPRLSEVAPSLVALSSVEAALVRLLAKNRDERPATALDAARLLQTAASNDLQPASDSRGQAALEGWTAGAAGAAAVSEQEIVRRSTIMIGSGSVAHTHDTETSGPATGDFAAKSGGVDSVRKRPSIIVAEGVPTTSTRTPDPSKDARAVAPESLSKTPTPKSVRLGKPSSGGLRRRHVPLIMIAVGAAIFAALVTIGFVRWLERRDARAEGATGAIVDPPGDRRFRAPADAADGRGRRMARPGPESKAPRA